VAKLLCSCLCLFDVIVDLHAMDEKAFNDFLIRKSKWISIGNKGLLIHDYCFPYVVEAFLSN
jgi:hypothetical protein